MPRIGSQSKKCLGFSLKHQVKQVKLDLSLCEEGVERKTQFEVSNVYLKQPLQPFSRAEGIGMDGSMEYLGIDTGTCLKKLTRRRKADCRELGSVQVRIHETRCQEARQDGHVADENMAHQSAGDALAGKTKCAQEYCAHDGQEGWRVSHHIFGDARNGVSTRNGCSHVLLGA